MEKKGWMYLHQHDSPPTVCGSNKKLGGVLQRHECWISGSTITDMGVSKKKGPPNHLKVFHYKSSILRYPYFWKHPYENIIPYDSPIYTCLRVVSCIAIPSS